MSILQSTPRVTSRLTTRLGASLVAVSAVIAVAVAALILALAGASHTTGARSARGNASSQAAIPVTQIYGTGVGLAVLDPVTGQMHGGGVSRGGEPQPSTRP